MKTSLLHRWKNAFCGSCSNKIFDSLIGSIENMSYLHDHEQSFQLKWLEVDLNFKTHFFYYKFCMNNFGMIHLVMDDLQRYVYIYICMDWIDLNLRVWWKNIYTIPNEYCVFIISFHVPLHHHYSFWVLISNPLMIHK
jgi:hypothetical protein